MNSQLNNIPTSQQMLQELVNVNQISIGHVAKMCQLSASTLYRVFSGERAFLRPQTFAKLFRFYLIVTVMK